MHHTQPPSYRRNIQQSLVSRPTSVHPQSPSPPAQPTNDDIEAVIQMATSSRQNPDGRSGPIKDTRTQLFVGNLPYRVRWQDLKDLFRRAGTVLRADVSLGPDNRSRGYGTVLLATAEDAGRAIDMFHGYSWQTRILEVRPDRLPPDFDNPLPAPTPNPVPPPSFSTSSATSLIPPLTSGTHVTSPPRAARPLSDDLDYNSFFGSEASNASLSTCRNLFVGNLPFHCQWQDLKDLFRQAGTIVRADVALGPDGRSRGFGTVVFATEQDAERAVKMLNGYEYNGRVLKVHFDRYSHLTQPSASPTSSTFHQAMSSATMGQPSFTTTMTSRPNHITLPIGYHSEFLPPSGPSSPYDLYHTKTPMFSQPSQPQGPSRSQPQLHEILSQRPSQEDDSGSNDMNSLSAKLASTSFSRKPGPISPPQNSRSMLHNANRSSDITTFDDNLHNAAPQIGQPQPQSQPQRSDMILAGGTTSPSQNQHPHHPGPISLPPPGLPFPVPPHTLSPLHHTGVPIPISPIQHPSMGSPLHHPSAYQSHQQMVSITPHGLPPITPSMPPFIFHPMPPPASPTASAHTPAAHVSMFGTPSFSPTVAMSPGTFWGRPGNHHPNPFINPTVGAPVHMHSPGATRQGGGGSVNVNVNVGGSAYFYAPPGAGRVEPTGYFDPAYFPPGSQHSTGLGPSGLSNEILEEEAELSSEQQDSASSRGGGGGGKEPDEDTPSTDRSPNDDDDDDNDDVMGRSRSQDSMSGTNTTCTTSWYNSEESGDERGDVDGQESGALGSSRGSVTSKAASSSSSGGHFGLGILSGERKIISRTHSMSGEPKPLFLTARRPGSDSDPPTRTTSSGQVDSLATTTAPPAAVPGWDMPFIPLKKLKGKELRK